MAKTRFNVHSLNRLMNTDESRRAELLAYGGPCAKIWYEGRPENNDFFA